MKASSLPVELRVLVVQARKDDAARIYALLDAANMSATMVPDGQSALVAMGSSQFDFAVVDDMLSDLSVQELMSEALRIGSELPAYLVVSQNPEVRSAVMLLRAGARDYLSMDSSFEAIFPEVLVHVRKDIETVVRLREAESALRKTERLYKLIAENVADVIFIYRPELARFSYFSPSIYKLCGIRDEQAVNMMLADFISPAEYEALHTDMHARVVAFKSGDDSRRTALYRVGIVTRGGGSVRADVLTTLVWGERGKLELVGVARDVEERALMEEAILSSLKEKEVLLKEIHHRVKNNLQIVSSMLSLQLHGMTNAKAAAALVDSQNRIQAMALVHEQLYRSPNLAEIAFRDYIQSFVPVLLQCSPVPVRAEYDVENCPLDIDLAVPCGLILNELIMNAVKHAFVATGDPALRIGFRRRENGQYLLTVEDNGSGLPEDVSPERTSSLGFTLVNSLVGQIAGRLEISSDSGTSFAIEFPPIAKK